MKTGECPKCHTPMISNSQPGKYICTCGNYNYFVQTEPLDDVPVVEFTTNSDRDCYVSDLELLQEKIAKLENDLNFSKYCEYLEMSKKHKWKAKYFKLKMLYHDHQWTVCKETAKEFLKR